MSIKERLSRMMRKSNTSNTSNTSNNSTSTSTTSDNEHKKTPSVVGRMLPKKFSRGKPSTSSMSSDLRSGSDTGHSDNANSVSRPSPANLDGLRWEDMTHMQRVQANFNTYEIRFGASNTSRVSLEGISPCTTQTRQPGPGQADYY